MTAFMIGEIKQVMYVYMQPKYSRSSMALRRTPLEP